MASNWKYVKTIEQMVKINKRLTGHNVELEIG
jgi:hypothetical protein